MAAKQPPNDDNSITDDITAAQLDARAARRRLADEAASAKRFVAEDAARAVRILAENAETAVARLDERSLATEKTLNRIERATDRLQGSIETLTAHVNHEVELLELRLVTVEGEQHERREQDKKDGERAVRTEISLDARKLAVMGFAFALILAFIYIGAAVVQHILFG